MNIHKDIFNVPQKEQTTIKLAIPQKTIVTELCVLNCIINYVGSESSREKNECVLMPPHWVLWQKALFPELLWVRKLAWVTVESIGNDYGIGTFAHLETIYKYKNNFVETNKPESFQATKIIFFRIGHISFHCLNLANEKYETKGPNVHAEIKKQMGYELI